jgi:uncharacterized protein YqhQ
LENKKKFNVGGQAVIEGVLMRSPHFYAVAVRRKNQEIEVTSGPVNSIAEKYTYLKWPFLRGFLSLIESMTLGFKALDFSAKIYEEESETKEEKEKKAVLTEEQKKSREKKETVITFTLSILFAVGIFIYLPILATKMIVKAAPALNDNRILFNLIIVFIKFLLFFFYIWGISFFEDVRRLFQYHGAEHKAIFTYEDGKELTTSNMKGYTTLHPRCGTAFIFITIIVSIFLFVLLLPPGFKIWQRLLLEIPLLIPIAGISYEILKLSDKLKDNFFVKIFISPGLAFQKITTKEPDNAQMEVAAKSIDEVLALEKTYIEKNPKTEKKTDNL